MRYRFIPIPYLMLMLLGCVYSTLSHGMEIGILPYLPTHTLLERYQALHVYLEKKLGEPVRFVTAPDYPTFFQRTARKEYAFVVTASHAARLAERESGYVPLLRPSNDISAILLVKQNSPYREIKDLRGKRISTPGAFSIVTLLGTQWLRNAGLRPGEEVTITAASTHTTAMHEVVDGVVDAAMISNRAFVAVKSDMKDTLRALGLSPTGGAGVVFMASPRVPAKTAAAFKAAVLAFVQTPEGSDFVTNLGYDNLRALAPNELVPMEPYAQELKKLLDTYPASK